MSTLADLKNLFDYEEVGDYLIVGARVYRRQDALDWLENHDLAETTEEDGSGYFSVDDGDFFAEVDEVPSPEKESVLARSGR